MGLGLFGLMVAGFMTTQDDDGTGERFPALPLCSTWGGAAERQPVKCQAEPGTPAGHPPT